MAQNTTTDDERTENDRFNTEVSANELIEGDYISKQLVARTPGQVGEQIHTQKDAPETQLVAVTALNNYDDSHSALLFDPSSEMFLRATRLDSQQAWTQQEADWTVREIGTDIVVEDVHELERPDGEQDQDGREYVQKWLEILFDDIRYSDGDREYHDEMELDGTTLKLREPEGRKALATVSLEG